jgi:hypothetical protein
MKIEASCYDAFDPSKGKRNSASGDKAYNFQEYSQVV